MLPLKISLKKNLDSFNLLVSEEFMMQLVFLLDTITIHYQFSIILTKYWFNQLCTIPGLLFWYFLFLSDKQMASWHFSWSLIKIETSWCHSVSVTWSTFAHRVLPKGVGHFWPGFECFEQKYCLAPNIWHIGYCYTDIIGCTNHGCTRKRWN